MAEQIDDLRNSYNGLKSDVKELQRTISHCDVDDMEDLQEAIDEIENIADNIEQNLKELDSHIDEVAELVDNSYPNEDDIFELSHYAPQIQLVTWTDVDKMKHLASVFNNYSLQHIQKFLP